MSSIIVFFDGVCGLCDRSVDFLIQQDQSKKFFYSPLQGEEIKKYPIKIEIEPESLLVWDGQKFLVKSEAWLFLMSKLKGWPSGLASIISVFPHTVLDFLYDFIARYRYRIFGKLENCRIPTPEERSRFLD